MDLLLPHIGLIFWTLLAFLLVLFILKKFAWKPIIQSLNERETTIADSISMAEKVKLEMAQLKNDNELLLIKAREERSALLKEAKEIKDKMISEAKEEARLAASKIIAEAQASINHQKMAALTEIKNQVGNLVIEVSGVLERLDKKNNSLEVDSPPTVVTSEKDLVDYIKALVRNNLNFTLVSVKEDAVSITRETPTKLFGVLDISSQETAEVISWGDGTSAVSVTRPWWSVFTKYDTRRDVVTNNLYVRMKDVSPALLTTNLSASTKARLIQEIQAAFEDNNTENNLSVE